MSNITKIQQLNFLRNTVLPSDAINSSLYIKSGDSYIPTTVYVKISANSYQPITRLSTSYDAIWASADSAFLNEKLNVSVKELNQYDFLKIDTIVNEENELLPKFNALLPNTSLIINSPAFSMNGKTYNRGDIVYKTKEGSESHIQAKRGGIFAPIKLEKEVGNNNFTFTYGYIPTAPDKESIPATKLGNVWTVDEVAKNISFEDMGISSPTAVYGYRKSKTDWASLDITFPVKSINNNAVQPIIKMFNASNEEVEATLTVTKPSTSWIIDRTTIPPIVETIIIK